MGIFIIDGIFIFIQFRQKELVEFFLKLHPKERIHKLFHYTYRGNHLAYVWILLYSKLQLSKLYF